LACCHDYADDYLAKKHAKKSSKEERLAGDLVDEQDG
jgi:hypothetical protein